MRANVGYNCGVPQRMRVLQRNALGILLLLAASGSLLAAQLSLKHNVTPRVGGGVYQGVKDSWMRHADKYNFGADFDLYVGEYQNGVGDSIILRFELPAMTCQGIPAATLSFWYVDSYQMTYNNTAIQIAPFRIKPGYWWDEGDGGSGGGHGGGQLNEGVNYWYRDSYQTFLWNPSVHDAGFYESTDDGNGRQWIKKTGGSVPEAYEPQQWVPFDVRPSVTNWYGGVENNGLGFYMQGYVGTDATAAGDFASKENTGYGETLAITYSGAQIVWAGASASTWDNTLLNWNVGGYYGTYGDGDLVTFADGASNLSVSVTGAGVAPGSVTVNNAATAYSFSGGSINGSGGVTKHGTGLVTLSAANGYGGLTVVRGGQLVVAADGALGAVGSGTVVSNGAALGFQGSVNYSAAEPLTISGAGGGGRGALYAVSGNNAFGGPVTLAANSTVGVDASLSLALNSAISGGFNFTKTGQGTLTFGGRAANTYGGTTYVQQGMLALVKSAGPAVPHNLVIGDGVNAATVGFGAQGQLYSECDVTVATSSQLDLNHHSSTIGSLTLSNGAVATGSGTLGLSGPVSSTGNQTASIGGKLNLGGGQREINVANGAAGVDLIVSAAISGGGIAKTGAGRLLLSGNNSFDGEVEISNGVLVAAASLALGSSQGGTTVAGGARLELQNHVTISSEALTLNGSGGGLGALANVSDTNTWTGTIALASASLIECATGRVSLAGVAGAGHGMTFNVSSMGDMLVNGLITGTGSALTKDGGGQLTLAANAANTYSGTTLVNEGTLVLSGRATPPNSPVIDVGAGSTLDVTGVTDGFVLGATAQQTLKGSGTVSGNVTAKALARLEPGESPGTLTFLRNLTLTAGVTNYFELTNSLAIGGGTNDLIVVAGDLTLNNNVIAITVLGSDPLGAGSYRLFNYAGGKTGAFNPTPVFLRGAPGPGSTAWVDESVTNQVNLVVVVPIATTTLVTSEPNPALPGSVVTITATVTATPTTTNMPVTGSVTFKTNSVPLGPPVPLDNSVAAMASTGLAHGLSLMWAEYPGNGQFLGSTGSVMQLVNTPPIPGYHVVYVLQNEELVLPVAALIANDNDPDGDPLNIVQVSALSTNGGTAALLGTAKIAYLPKPDYVGSDRITYTLADPYTTVTVPVNIHVLSGGGLTNNILSITNLSGGAVMLTATGIPGWTYQVQAVSNLTFPLSWQTLSTRIADTNGRFQFTDLGATNAEGYYRMATSTNPPDYRIYNTELLQLDIVAGGTHTGVLIRESPMLPSLGATRIEIQTTGLATISSFFDVFSEMSLNNGMTWFPATNGSVPVILVGGTPLNKFPGCTLPPAAGQYISPPEWPALYPQGVVIKHLTLHSFTAAFPPPAPAQTVIYHLGATVDLWVSFDGGHTFRPVTAPVQVKMLITGRPGGSF